MLIRTLLLCFVVALSGAGCGDAYKPMADNVTVKKPKVEKPEENKKTGGKASGPDITFGDSSKGKVKDSTKKE